MALMTSYLTMITYVYSKHLVILLVSFYHTAIMFIIMESIYTVTAI